MIVAVDVHYRKGGTAGAAAVAFEGWTAAAPVKTVTAELSEAAPYRPGAFYLRELPAILAVLDEYVRATARGRGMGPGMLGDRLGPEVEAIVVDGYVWLGEELPGLGARLWKELEETIPVVGVAKSRFAGAPATEVLRGRSARPLYLTSAGIDAADAARSVGRMHGDYRIPSMLRLADRLARRCEAEVKPPHS